MKNVFFFLAILTGVYCFDQFKHSQLNDETTLPTGGDFSKKNDQAVQIEQIRAAASIKVAIIMAKIEEDKLQMEEKKLKMEEKMRLTNILTGFIHYTFFGAVIYFGTVAIRDGLIGRVSDIGKFFNSINPKLFAAGASMWILAGALATELSRAFWTSVGDGVKIVWNKIRR